MDDYRAIYAKMDDLDEYYSWLEEELEEQQAMDWVPIDRTNMYCTFMNRAGEVRTIGAQYVDACFEGE